MTAKVEDGQAIQLFALINVHPEMKEEFQFFIYFYYYYFLFGHSENELFVDKLRFEIVKERGDVWEQHLAKVLKDAVGPIFWESVAA